MLKAHFLSLTFLALAEMATAQNLVPNPSFEEYTLCPVNQAQIDRATGWQAVRGNCDFIHECGPPGITGLPSNMWGWQYAATGLGYAQVISFSEDDGNPLYLREWIGRDLAQPMVIGTQYFVSVKFSWTLSTDTLIGSIRFANDHMGVLFRTAPFTSNDGLSVPNFAHVWTDSIITDSAGWTTVSGSIIADSAYSFIAIGNFFDDIVTNALELHPAGMWQFSYYYVDDVCVSVDPMDCGVETGVSDDWPMTWQMLPNPASDHTVIRGWNGSEELAMWDLRGRRIGIQVKEQGQGKWEVRWAEPLAAGMYLLQMRLSTGQQQTHKLVVR